MKGRVRIALVLCALVASLGAVGSQQAQACMGQVCDAFCDVANSKPGQKLFPNGARCAE